MAKISVVINTLNEEKNLPKALATVKGFADEVVVVDAKSTDKTADIAKENGAKVYTYKGPIGYVEPARNFAIEKAKGNWILILDADEEVSPGLSKRLKKLVNNPKADYYRLPRKNIIFGKWIKHSRWWPDYNIRLFKKGKVSWGEIIHSVPTTVGKGLDLEADPGNAIVHKHYSSIEQYIERMNRYTSEHAKLKVKEGYKFKWADLIKRPMGEFLSRYFQAEGYKDGVHGLALAGLQGFSELVLYLKIWQKQGFKSQSLEVSEVADVMKEAENDIHYWQADTLIKQGSGPLQRLKRKFKLS